MGPDSAAGQGTSAAVEAHRSAQGFARTAAVLSVRRHYIDGNEVVPGSGGPHGVSLRSRAAMPKFRALGRIGAGAAGYAQRTKLFCFGKLVSK
jgi:hypothetical protein